MLIYVYNLLKIDPLLFFFSQEMEDDTSTNGTGYQEDIPPWLCRIDRWGRSVVGSAEERNRRTSYLSDSWRTAQRGSPLRQRADVQPPSAEDFCPGCTLETRLACSQPTQGSTPLLFVLLELTSRSLCLSLYRPCCCCCSTERSGLLSAART